MQKIIIADTSSLILLDKINELQILQLLFREIIITSVIEKEFANQLPSWIKIKNVSNVAYQTILEVSVDAGEASAIALALEEKDCLLILDDLKGRKLATELGIKITGTLGVLVEAKLSGHIKMLKPILEKIKQTNFRITAELENKILDKVAE